MNPKHDLLSAESHFDFGRNWASYSERIGAEQIALAADALQRLCGDRVRGGRFLDIGCGSGLHSLAALNLGANEIVAVDLDENSVATAKSLLERSAAGREWNVIRSSVFALEGNLAVDFDIVYSWGVLHHTGDLDRALRVAARFVRPGGLFCFALYRRTLLCPVWKIEKRWYSGASERGQRLAQSVFRSLLKVKLRIAGRSMKRHVAEYGRSNRGMDFWHDMHDWLGGYPYESISPTAVHRLLDSLGFVLEREFVKTGRPIGLFGSGCDEYVYRRT